MQWLHFLVISCFIGTLQSTIAAPVHKHLLQKRVKTADIRGDPPATKVNAVLYTHPADAEDGSLTSIAAPSTEEAKRATWDHIVPLEFIIKTLLTGAGRKKLDSDATALTTFKTFVNHPNNFMPLEGDIDNAKGPTIGGENISKCSLKKIHGVRNLLVQYQAGGAKHDEATKAINKIIEGIKKLETSRTAKEVTDSSNSRWSKAITDGIQKLDNSIKLKKC